MKLRLIDDWSTELHRLWSIRFSIGFAVFTGVAGVLGAFTETLDPWVLLALSVFVNLALIPLSRLVKQEGKPKKKGARR